LAADKLCFGGSFNPIHFGHLRCAKAAALLGGYSQIVLIPSPNPRLKPAGYSLASPGQRLQMCRLAVEQDSLFQVDPIEIDRAGVTRTIDTVLALKARGWPVVNWLIGADQVRNLPNWIEAERLIDEANFVVMARPGQTFDWASLPAPFRKLESKIIPTPLIDLSATEIRARVEAGLPIEHMTPPAVVDYILQHNLYR